MSMLLSLWLPIVATTVVLFFASFLAWVVLPHHKPDAKRWPDEDRLMKFVRESGAVPGEYLFPLIEGKEMQEDWAQADRAKGRYAEGPWGTVNLWSKPPSPPRNMLKTVLFFLVVTTAVAYIGTLGLSPGASVGEVFRLTGITAILAHTSGGVLREIWFTRPLRAKLMDALDGVAYGVLTGLIFAWLWV